MAPTSDRIQEALSAHLDYVEMGGTKPDTTHLNSWEQEELDRLIEGLRLTEGMQLGLGRSESPDVSTDDSTRFQVRRVREAQGTDQQKNVVSVLREALPFDSRIDLDPVTFISRVGEFEIEGQWIVGTFGGRVRVWLLDVETAHQLETNTDLLGGLNKAFRSLPDTAAVVLVGKDLSCLLIEPEDCSAQIQVPDGSLMSRRYSRPVQALTEAVRGFMNEHVPHWDPVPEFQREGGLVLDGTQESDEFARVAVEEQVTIGQRARSGNPKKEALLGFGGHEIAGLKKLSDQLLGRKIKPEEVEKLLEKLARKR